MAQRLRTTTACALMLTYAIIPAGAFAGGAGHAASTDLQLANIFSDHAVLQRDVPLTIWGTSRPGSHVTVKLGNVSVTATSAPDGTWDAQLPAMPAGGPFTLAATADGKTARFADIMIGDVYLCGGQSNMEFPAKFSTGAWSGLATQPNPDLRYINVPKRSEATEQSDLAARVTWNIVDANTVGDASAVCYYMARSLQRHLGVPVGFVSSDWGGTTIQGWISSERLSSLPSYRAGEAMVDLMARNPADARTAESRRREQWWLTNIPDADKDSRWILGNFDASRWGTLPLRGGWKDTGIADLKNFDGVMRYRTIVDLTDAQAAAGKTVELGPIDTIDDVWVNGQWVGGSGVDWLWRDYSIPASLLHAGSNTIAVRVLSNGKRGGMTGTSQNQGIRLVDGSVVPFASVWRYQRGPSVADAPILSPPPWEPPQSLSTLYNGMIAPIVKYRFKLAAWYQGESNTGAADEYATLLPMLLADWRAHLREPRMPFLIVQLAAFGEPVSKPVESGWARIRDIEAKVARADPNAAVAASIDVGDPASIHPTEKGVVGERLARAARAVAYREDIVQGGPYPASIERTGRDLVIDFVDTGGGLQTYSANAAIGFEACTAGDDCHFVAGEVAGNRITLPGANAPGIVKIRYAWSDAPFVNLFGKTGEPAIPFEQDISGSRR